MDEGSSGRSLLLRSIPNNLRVVSGLVSKSQNVRRVENFPPECIEEYFTIEPAAKAEKGEAWQATAGGVATLLFLEAHQPVSELLRAAPNRL